MLRIDLHFQRFCNVSLTDIYDETGVYVIWNGKAKARPTYIGEGNVLRRFVDHLKKPWAHRPIDGVLAIIGNVQESKKKPYAELVEAVLLFEANRINRFPTKNQSPGKAKSALEKSLKYQGHNIRTIRLIISGRDPLIDPIKPPIKDNKIVVLKQCEDGDWYVDKTCWNVRA